MKRVNGCFLVLIVRAFPRSRTKITQRLRVIFNLHSLRYPRNTQAVRYARFGWLSVLPSTTRTRTRPADGHAVRGASVASRADTDTHPSPSRSSVMTFSPNPRQFDACYLSAARRTS